MNENSWGWHLAIDASGLNHQAITSKETIAAFAKKLVNDIDMIAFGEPQVVHFGEGNKEGFTLVQLIETSNICAHFNNIDDTGYIDVFSCKPFEKKIVLKVVKEFFGTKTLKYKSKMWDRNAPR